MKRIIFAIVFVFAFSALVYAENLYVTPTGAGATNGSDWNNAFAGFKDVAWGAGAGQLGPDDTLWVAGGTYSAEETSGAILELKGSGTAGHILYIKRALATDVECTGATGWSAGYDSQVVLSGKYGIYLFDWVLTGPGRYVVIDGRIKDGIKIAVADTSGYGGIFFKGQGSFNSVFRYIGVYGQGVNITPGYSWTNNIFGIELSAYTTSGHPVVENLQDITFEYCTITGFSTGFMIGYLVRGIIQYCDIHTINNVAPSTHHENIAYHAGKCDDVTWRYNIFHDSWFATGLFFTNGGASGFLNSNIKIYGNIFRDGLPPPESEAAIRIRSGDDGHGPFFIYDNTFANIQYCFIKGGALASSAQSYFQNNLSINVSNTTPASDPYLTISNNLAVSGYGLVVSEGSTGVLAAPYDWQYVRNLDLSTWTPVTGTILSSPYNIDYEGKTRGVDGLWDVGAYEFEQSPTVTITGPTSAATYLTKTSPITTLAGTATAPVGWGAITWGCTTCTPTSGSGTGTDNWTIASIGLGEGANIITVKATDTGLNEGTDVITVTLDTAAPTISAISSGTPLSTSVTITWTTDEASSTQIKWGDTDEYLLGTTTLNPSLVTSHSQSIGSLTPNTHYHFKVISIDAAGNTSAANDNNFTTALPATEATGTGSRIRLRIGP